MQPASPDAVFDRLLIHAEFKQLRARYYAMLLRGQRKHPRSSAVGSPL
jgi:hypothetical protein